MIVSSATTANEYGRPVEYGKNTGPRNVARVLAANQETAKNLSRVEHPNPDLPGESTGA